MYRVLTIGGEEYRLEYSIEASLYSDCVESVSILMTQISSGENPDMKESERIKSVLSGIANIPKTALQMFYAGLIEAHGPNGDGRVPDLLTAKALVKTFLTEHKDDETGNFYGLMEMCLDQMGEDGFFKLAGLEAAISEPDPKRKPKVPQDHKKSEKKASGK